MGEGGDGEPESTKSISAPYFVKNAEASGVLTVSAGRSVMQGFGLTPKSINHLVRHHFFPSPYAPIPLTSIDREHMHIEQREDQANKESTFFYA